MRWWTAGRRGAARRAAILLPSLFRADATGNDALGMHEALCAEGWDARLFAENWGHGIDAAGLRAARNFLSRQRPLVIYHQATRWDAGIELLKSARGPILVRDHNVTPARFFIGVSDEFSAAAEFGAATRRRLAVDPRVTRFLAASSPNASELVALGAPSERVLVLPPFHCVEQLSGTVPDEAFLRRFAHHPTAVLFVGRVAPHKGHRRIQRIAAAYRELFGGPLTVRFAGPSDKRMHRWTSLLEKEKRWLGVDGSITFLGELTPAELKAAYLTSQIFLCCSEHEGFCVPLVEAASFGLPILATYQEGVAATLGEHGLVLRDASDELVAVALRRLLCDPELRDQLVAAQRARFRARFSAKAIRTAFLRSLTDV